MRSITFFSAVMLSLFMLASCGGGKEQWAVYTSGEGGFSVRMPGKVDKTDKTEVTPFGKQKTHFVTWKPSAMAINKFKLFQVSYTECPQKFIADTVLLDVMLDSSIRMRYRDFTEKVDVQGERIELNGYPGRAFIYDGKDDITIVKQCITNGRKYDLTVIVKKDQGTNPEISEFFNSFQVLK